MTLETWIILAGFAGIMFGIHDVFSKLALERTSVYNLTFVATAATAVIWLAVVFFSSVKITDTSLDTQVLIAFRSIGLTASWLLSFTALASLPLSYGTPIRASGPLWSLAFAYVFLGQALTVVQVYTLFAVCAAYVLLTHANVTSHQALSQIKRPLVYMLLATWLSALIAVYDKHLVAVQHIDVRALQFHASWQRTLLCAALLMWHRRSTSWKTWSISSWWLAAVATGSAWFAAEWLYFLAVAVPQSDVAVMSALRRMSIVVSAIVGIYWLSERGRLYSRIVGTLLLLCGFFLLALVSSQPRLPY